MSFKDSFDSKVLRWSGFAVAAFLAAAFAMNAQARPSGVGPSATYAACLTQPNTVIR